MALFGKRSSDSGSSRQPVFIRMQDFLNQMEIGTGRQLFRLGMFFLLMMFVILLYAGTQFNGLHDSEAMNIAQLARNLSRHQGYVTRFFRPLELGYLKKLDRPQLNEDNMTQPELWTPPVYPWILSQVFRVVNPAWSPEKGSRSVPGDRAMMILNWFWFALGLLLTYLLARELFDNRVATLSIFIYLFCDTMLDAAISGLPLSFLTLLFVLVALAVVKAERWQAEQRKPFWMYGAVGVAALAVGVGTLTQYAFAAVLPGLIVYLILIFRKRWYLPVLLTVVVYGLVLAPWVMRNRKVSHTWFSLSYYELYEGTGMDTLHQIKPGELQRAYSPSLRDFQYWFMARQWLINWRTMYEGELRDLGSGFLAAFFVVGLLHRFRRDPVLRARWFLVLTLAAAMIWVGITGPPSRNFLTIFAPLAIILAAAFFFVLFERMQLRQRLGRVITIGAFCTFNALSFVFTILPPSAPLPYPPYDGVIVWLVGQAFPTDALLASDIPWAVAWYADRACVWTPTNEKDYLAINDGVKHISGIYITQVTLKNFDAAELASNLIAQKPVFWLRGFPLLAPPPGFPLQNRELVTPDRQQYLISSGERPQPKPNR